MPRPAHYSPVIHRFLVSALYHEARRRKMPMTKLADIMLTDALKDTHGWKKATSARVAEEPMSYTPPRVA